jgi:hypothetical protein
VAACKKSENGSTESGTLVKGKIVLQISVMHHTWAVPGINVYMKLNTLNFPGSDTTLYDQVAKADNEGVVQFDGLFPGNFFIYAKGYDPIFRANVVGGAPLTLNSSNVTNNEAYLTLQVTE